MKDKWELYESGSVKLYYFLGLFHSYLADYFIVFSLGYDTENNCPLGTVEVYDPDNDTWSSIASLVHPRRRFGMAVVNGIIYVAGGYFEHSVEWYDEKNDQWRVYEGVTVNRHDFTCLALPVPHCW